jgi:ribosomal protein L37AE/L43A
MNNPFARIPDHLCFYCGALATGRDHIHPKACSAGKRTSKSGSKTVWACQECNVTLKAAAIYDARNRAYYLLLQYRRSGKASEERIRWLEGVALVECRSGEK